MSRPRTKLALLAVLALLAPATAAAQNPGDEQYSDPLAPNEQPGGGGGGGGGGGDEAGGGGPPATAGEAQPGGDEAPATQSQAPGTSASGELPRTGFPAGLMALLGGGMLAGGAALRRRLS